MTDRPANILSCRCAPAIAIVGNLMLPPSGAVERWVHPLLRRGAEAQGRPEEPLKEEKEKVKKRKKKGTSHPRIAHGQRYPMPCLE